MSNGHANTFSVLQSIKRLLQYIQIYRSIELHSSTHNSYDHCTLQLSIDAVRGSPINPAAELVNEEPSFSQGEQSMEENIKPMDFFVAGSCLEIATS